MQTDDTLRALGLDPQVKLRPSVVVRMGRKPASWPDDMAHLGFDPRPQKDDRGDPIWPHIPERWLSREGPPKGVWGRTQIWLCQRPGSVGMASIAPLHPDATAYNVAARRTLALQVVHATLGNAVHHGRAAHELPGHSKPPGGRLPTCATEAQADPDGRMYARRWVQGAWKRVCCPGDGAPGVPPCPFTIPDSKGKTACPRSAFLIAQIAEPGLPSLRVELEASGPWGHAERQWLAFEGAIQEQYDLLAQEGLIDGQTLPSLYGLPIRITLRERTGEGSRFHVPELDLNLPPGKTLQGWLLAKAQGFNAIAQLHTPTTALITADAPTILPTRGTP